MISFIRTELAENAVDEIEQRSTAKYIRFQFIAESIQSAERCPQSICQNLDL